MLSFLPLLTDSDWKVPVVPLAVNVIQHPIPTARRLYRLGGALGRAIESYPKDKRIVVFGTGGLTHQLHGSKFGTKNVAWDNEFMDRLETDPAGLSELSIQEYMERGGTEGVEMIMWLAMRGALGEERSAGAPELHRAVHHRLWPAGAGDVTPVGRQSLCRRLIGLVVLSSGPVAG